MQLLSRSFVLLALSSLGSASFGASQADADAPALMTPEAHLGRPLGRDFELADWSEVSGYFRHLGASSARVDVSTVGTTTEGRDFQLAVISSESNLARLEELKAISARIADPRGLSEAERLELLGSGKVFVFVSCAMHATETAAPQFGMELAHRLATSDEPVFQRAREELVVLLAPSLNPDGLDRVVSWYRETVGTPYEATGLLELYQYYTGHDNNRDWFGLTQAETRIVTRLLYSDWHPQVYWDVHQQGTGRERFFVPPYRDPLNPNLDPGVITGIGALGGRALFDMTREGFRGVSTGVTYDMWWNGGNRNVPVRHNIIGILTEAASVNIASPIFIEPDSLRAPRGLSGYAPSNRFPAPWPGGWWRLRDIIDYEHAFSRSLFTSLAGERETWLGNALRAAERVLVQGQASAPRAWILPSDNEDLLAVERLTGDLLLGGVDLFLATDELVVDGRTWPAGSVVIPMDQPYGAHVKDLFEVQRYPDGEPPYDVAGWTLPLLFGVHRVAAVSAIEGALEPVTDAAAIAARFAAANERPERDARSGASWRWAIEQATQGAEIELVAQAEAVQLLPRGAREGAEGEAEEAPAQLRSAPRIGVYAPWRGTMNEGWMRWVFDTFGVPFVRVRNEMVLAGDLGKFLDVLVMPSVSPNSIDRGRSQGSVASEYAGGLAPEGAVAIEQFVRAGGTLVTMEGSARWAVELFGLPVRDVTREPRDEGADFACPGSVLRAVPAKHAHTLGLDPSLALFFSRSSAWSIDQPKKKDEPDAAGLEAPELEVLLRYAPTRTLLSGWIQGAEAIAGQPAWVRASVGAGRVELFGFRPQYRGWSQDAFELLLRAVYLK